MSLDLNIGRAMIAVGILMLAICFIYTYNQLTNLRITKEGTGIEAIMNVSAELITIAIPLIFIGVLVWISSIVLDKGIKLVSELKKSGKKEEKH
ncbi:MAG: hypothetical protein DRJ66_06565 [Thermoprotei archaeon]|nr:MAG: hypothetical protein DRJ66_06565 [Thermoprotei archaeon]RLF20665.1 MAG: hypothetical protein DRZ82_01430 [Thermoprotei archaeon]